MSYYLGVDLGGTKIRIALARTGSEVFAARTFSTEAKDGAAAVLHRLKQEVDKMLEEERCPLKNVAGLGICAAGFYDRNRELMVSSPNLPGWDELPIKSKLENTFGLPVIVENDASAAAYGEYCFGAGRAKNNLLLLTLGTGIGGGLVLEGSLYHGSSGFAGEIGHIPLQPGGPVCSCGRKGCLEAFASGTALARDGRELLNSDTPTLLRELIDPGSELRAEHIFAAARKGDRPAAQLIEAAAFYLGRALAIATAILNPDIIVLSGGMAANGDLLLEPLRRHFFAAALPLLADGLEITAGMLKDDSGIRGVIALLEHQLMRQKK